MKTTKKDRDLARGANRHGSAFVEDILDDIDELLSDIVTLRIDYALTPDSIVVRLMAMKPDDRVAIFNAIQSNRFFCPHCGFGSLKTPNPNCQCTNDE